jgi:hypothetical protein
MMRQFVRMFVRRVVTSVAPDQFELRHGALRQPAVGLGMVRYVLQLEPLAVGEHLRPSVAAIAPTMQRYLTGPLDAGARP